MERKPYKRRNDNIKLQMLGAFLFRSSCVQSFSPSWQKRASSVEIKASKCQKHSKTDKRGPIQTFVSLQPILSPRDENSSRLRRPAFNQQISRHIRQSFVQ